MGRTVALIIGTYYCGSSLLNLLLDAQPGIRGLGEAGNLLRQQSEAPCAVCATSVRDCPVRALVDPGRFYGSLFDHYSDCEVLVDSSKSVQYSLGVHPFEWDLEHRVLLLTKAPHEFAWSCIHHQQEQTPESAFDLYLEFYRRQLHLLSEQSWFRPGRCLRLTYRRLTLHTEATLRRVLEFLRCDGEPVEIAWQTDTHIIGGNWMVAAQLRDCQGPFTVSDGYLRGKYHGKYHTIFYDGQWQTDKDFVAASLQLYESRRDELEEALRALGQPDVAQQIADLSAALGLRPCT